MQAKSKSLRNQQFQLNTSKRCMWQFNITTSLNASAHGFSFCMSRWICARSVPVCAQSGQAISRFQISINHYLVSLRWACTDQSRLSTILKASSSAASVSTCHMCADMAAYFTKQPFCCMDSNQRQITVPSAVMLMLYTPYPEKYGNFSHLWANQMCAL